MTNDHKPPTERNRLETERKRHANAQRQVVLIKIINSIYFLTAALGILLMIRILLKLFGANPQNQFASFIYALSAPFVAPFNTLFPTPSSNTAVLEINSIVAIAAYALLAWLIGRLILLIGSNPE